MAKDLKNTLNLPQTRFPMRGDLVKREPARMQHWQNSDLYSKFDRRFYNPEFFPPEDFLCGCHDAKTAYYCI